MSTRIPPTCVECGTSASGEGFTEEPGTGRVLCMPCALPNADQRERVVSEAIAELLRRYQKDNGRQPDTLLELAEWAAENPGPTRHIVALTA